MKAIINFDQGTAGSLQPEVKTAIDDFFRNWEKGETAKWMRIYRQSKEAFAELIGTTLKNVAGIPNVSTAAGLVASALPLGPGSNIVVSGLEFPSNVYPWMALQPRGTLVRIATSRGNFVPISEFEKLMDENTTIVAVSHVIFSTGYRYNLDDLVDLVHRVGAFLFVDAYQSAGAIKINLTEANVDFLCTGSSKWLLGPPGAGFLYVDERVAEKLHPPVPSWLCVSDVFDLSPKYLTELKGAAKFETGTPNLMGYAGVMASIVKIKEYGIENVEKRILSLTQWLIEELVRLGLEVITPREKDQRAGIVVFKTKTEPLKVIHRLREEGIIVWKRGDRGVRFSIHFTNREDEIDYAVKTLRNFSERGLL